MRRRDFLGSSAGLLGAALLAGCGNGAAEDDVAIVGGGLAGLTAAYRLKQLGTMATVYEGSARLGGRVLTDRTSFLEGQHAELGGERIDSTHATILALCKELAVEVVDSTPGGIDLYPVGGALLTPAEAQAALAPIQAALESARDNAVALDALSLAAWLDSIGASGAGRTLFELAATAKYGLDPDALGISNLLLRPLSDERFRISAGSDSLVGRLAAALLPGQVVLRHRLLAVAPRTDGRIRCTFDTGGDAVDVIARRVVLALPFSTLRTCALSVELPSVQRQAIAELGYGTGNKVAYGFFSRFWTEAGDSGTTLGDLGWQTTRDASLSQAGSSGILVNQVGGQRGIDSASSDRTSELTTFATQLDTLIPGAVAQSSGTSSTAAWPTAPFSLGSVSAFLPGQATAFSGALAAASRNVYFCGEHTAGVAAGTMEGAVASATTVAMLLGSG
ncbi:MAG: NAD(P)/FAD-dependent oxidoreductase [Polyangia bacterium]